MRNKDWVEIHSKNPDHDAILCASFFKSAKNGSQTIFKGGKSLVYFHIPNSVYGSYEAWLEECEFQKLFSDESVTQNVGHRITSRMSADCIIPYLDSHLS